MADPMELHARLLLGVSECAGFGWPVFPCGTNKAPLTETGFKAATMDAKQRALWWGKTPDASIGVPTGTASSMWALDLDEQAEKDISGLRWLAAQEAKHTPLPRGPKVRTPRGGVHLYFQLPGDRVVKNSAGKIGAGVDVRGEGGYVIVPPSRSDRGNYIWEVSPHECPLPEAPSWLLDLVCPPLPAADHDAEPSDAPNQETINEADGRLVEIEFKKQISKVQSAKEGTRNRTLNDAAFVCGKMVGAGVLSETKVLDELRNAAQAAGLSRQEIRATIRSGMNAGKRRPWRPYARDALLAELNRDYFFAVEGKSGLIFREEINPLMRTRSLARLYPGAFRDQFGNRSIKRGDRSVKLGDAWMTWPDRRQYDKVVFYPGRDLPISIYNQWQGFAADAIDGVWERFRTYMLIVICGGDEVLFGYLLSWCARAVQQPWTPGEVAIVFKGKKGIGKTFFAEHFGELFGDHFVEMTNSRHLVGNFNAHLETAVIVFADEAFWAGDKPSESTLKGLITGRYLLLERKGVDAKRVPNYTHLIMASNSDWVVPASTDERRYFVLNVSAERKDDHAYFSDLENEWQNSGREAFLYQLMNLDISEFNVRKVPQTDALLEQKLLSLSVIDRWYLTTLQNGSNTYPEVLLSDGKSSEWAEWVMTSTLYTAMSEFCKEEHARVPAREAFGMRLSQLLASPADGKSIRRQRQHSGGKREWGYQFGELTVCRQNFEKIIGFKIEWDSEGEVANAPSPKF